MTATIEQTAGQRLAATLRRLNRIGTRTRRYRGGADLHTEMLDAIRNATEHPGCYQGDTHKVLTSAWTIWCGWSKHVHGHRIDPVLRWQISQLSPWQLAALLGRMVDAGVQNTGQAEMFFADLAREHKRTVPQRPASTTRGAR